MMVRRLVCSRGTPRVKLFGHQLNQLQSRIRAGPGHNSHLLQEARAAIKAY